MQLKRNTRLLRIYSFIFTLELDEHTWVASLVDRFSHTHPHTHTLMDCEYYTPFLDLHPLLHTTFLF